MNLGRGSLIRGHCQVTVHEPKYQLEEDNTWVVTPKDQCSCKFLIGDGFSRERRGTQPRTEDKALSLSQLMKEFSNPKPKSKQSVESASVTVPKKSERQCDRVGEQSSSFRDMLSKWCPMLF